MKCANRNKQQGVVLVIALIALVAISLAGVALMRTVDTSNVVSGNIAFNESVIQLADVGGEFAYGEIGASLVSNTVVPGCLSTVAACTPNAAGNMYFYPNVADIDPVSRLPKPAGGLSWSDPRTIALPGDPAGSPTYSVQYVIERMCVGTASLQEVATFQKCRAVPIYTATGVPLPINTTASALPSDGRLYFRVTVQVTGPRSTRALAQYFYGFQDTVYQ